MLRLLFGCSASETLAVKVESAAAGVNGCAFGASPAVGSMIDGRPAAVLSDGIDLNASGSSDSGDAAGVAGTGSGAVSATVGRCDSDFLVFVSVLVAEQPRRLVPPARPQ